MAKKHKAVVSSPDHDNITSDQANLSEINGTTHVSSVNEQDIIEKIDHMHFILAGLLASVRNGFASLMGVTSFQYVLMQMLGRSPEDMEWTVRSVARAMHMTDAYVSTEIADLVQKELIAKTGNPIDRRVSFLSLTQKGHQALAAIAPVQAMINKSLLSRLDEDRATLYAESLSVSIAEAGHAIDILKGLTSVQRDASLAKMRP